LIVPSFYLRHVRQGDAFKYKIDETGREYEAQILRVGAAVDPVSQTVKIIAVFSGPVSDVLAGMSGTANLQSPEASQ
jgi:membrane fusion protein, multidrug efflux system